MVSAAAGGLAPVGFKHSCLYSHLETMASPSRPQACMVLHQDLLEMWEADVAVWDCWFTNQKRLYDAQSQEPDEMRRLHLANQQWVQEEEERREEESQRKRRRTDAVMAEHVTRANAAWLKGRIDALQRLLKVQTDGTQGVLKIQTDAALSRFASATDVLREWLPDETDVRRDQLLTDTINLEARFKFKTDALHEWLAVETDALYDRIVGEEVITFHEQLKIETDRLHEQINIDVGRLDEMTQFDVDAHCERLVSRIDALQGLRWGQTGTPV